MDPEITLVEMYSAFDCGDYDDAIEYANYLIRWMTRGGFAPSDVSLATVQSVRMDAMRLQIGNMMV